MMHRRSTIMGALMLVVAMGTSQPALAADPAPVPGDPFVPSWQPWAELGGRASSDLSGGQATLFAPWALGHDSLLFVELRGKLLEQDVREGNVALGYRGMLANGWNVGLWGGFDIHKSRFNNTFHQASGGVELLHPNWDFRVNGYMPLDDRKSISRSSSTDTSSGLVLTEDRIFLLNETITRLLRRDEVALRGFDGEVGWRIPVGNAGPGADRNEVRIYGGGFHFDRGSLGRSATGPMGRLEWRINDVVPRLPGSRFTLEAGISHDRVRHTAGYAGLNFRVPIGRPPTPLLALDAQSRRMIEPLVRQHTVITRRVAKETTTVDRVEEQVADALTNVRFDRVARVEDGGSITDTSATAGANTLIIADGGSISGPQQLQGDQTLLGGGTTIDVVGVNSGTVAPLTGPGSRPSLTHDGNAPNLRLLGSNIHVAGIAIRGAGQFSGFKNNRGILVGPDSENTFIGHSEIFEVGYEGIDITSRNGVTIYQTVIRNTGDDGIDISGDDNVVTITDLVTRDTNDEGIDINGFRNMVSIADVTITNAGAHGIEIDNQFHNVDIRRLMITNTLQDGINLLNDQTVTIRDVSITNAGRHGIGMGNNNEVTIADTTIQGTARNGIVIRDGNTVDISNTRLQDLGDNGIRLDSGSTVILRNSIITGNVGGDGIHFRDGNNTLDGDGNSAAGANFAGQFCEEAGFTQIGFISFEDDGTGNPGTCP